MKVYVVTAYRWGDKESHSYVVGAYNNSGRATCAAEVEEDFRGGKYSCEVVEIIVDELPRLDMTSYTIVRSADRLLLGE